MTFSRLLSAAFLTLVPSIAPAASIQPCVPDTLSNYLAPGRAACSIGDVAFSDLADIFVPFGFSTSKVLVIPHNIPHHPAIELQFNQAVSLNDYVQFDFDFNLRVLPGGEPLFQASTTIAGSEVNGPGQIRLVERLCPGAAFPRGSGCPTTSAILTVATQVPEFNLSGFAGFEPQTVLGLRNHLVASFGPGNRGSAFFGSAVMEFDQVPEPATVGMVVGGLAFCALRLRLMRRCSAGRRESQSDRE